MEEKEYQVIIATPAKKRYHDKVLPYLHSNFSFERAIEIDGEIIQTAASLNLNPFRGRKEDYLKEMNEEFRFILFKETKHFELKIIYFVDEKKEIVYVTDFFPTKMHPQRMTENL